ncbi:leucine-rich repeat-containing protein 41 isoform X3 [Gadus macrocephalus]|uniref:leucine-rich repeat-containing protein 41 isoform X3 n=1 Tax=Gadus macrocephalus TaxID=80720 RepID=UPI0028CB9BC3|nr:leucine-rich repeat-containing protein 41 isoform X3 [Gadus macrocephalus]
MHEAYAEEVLQLAAKTEPPRPLSSLKLICIRVASRHVADIDVDALIGLPVSLIKDLLPQLSIYDLIRLQPALNQRGISTQSAWVLILQDIKGAHRVLDLHSEDGRIFRVSEVKSLAKSLKQLWQTSRSSLVDLGMAVLPQSALMALLLDACPGLHSLSLEIHPLDVDPGPHGSGMTHEPTYPKELSLRKLSVKVPQVMADIHSITAVLKHSPHLTSLHISGIRLPNSSSHRDLLTSISESNHRLRTLHLEDLNLADCHQDILNLLRNCMLEELSLKDCRLLERCSDRESYLQQFIDSLKQVRSLRSLDLSQNRLAKSAPTLAELFTGSPASAVKRLDISSNFIQPAELLELGQRLQMHPPQQRLTLDLRKNPWDRDRETWHDALQTLRPLCDFQTDGWKSRNTMADHISNM